MSIINVAYTLRELTANKASKRQGQRNGEGGGERGEA